MALTYALTSSTNSGHNMIRLTAIDMSNVCSLGWLPTGVTYCVHCNGYGSSLKDPVDTNTCTCCGGTGLMKEKK